MRIKICDDGRTHVYLSRRNLRALLAKLDGSPPASFCTIGGGDVAPGLFVTAEEDEAHYGDRAIPAGEMHPDTERAMVLSS